MLARSGVKVLSAEIIWLVAVRGFDHTISGDDRDGGDDIHHHCAFKSLLFKAERISTIIAFVFEEE